MKIIGLAGTNGSGKDTIGHLLADKYGYLFADATAMLGAELDKRGLPHERANKSALSAEWRREHGMAVIVDKALEAFESGEYKGLIVGSLRHPAEAERVHELGGSVIWVDAEPKIRYERVTNNDRGRLEDKKSFKKFMEEEASEMSQSGDLATLNMGAVKEQADLFIQNNGNDIELFKADAEKSLVNLL